MIKNDKGEIEIEGGKVPHIILEWMQLTQAVTIAIKDGTGVDMDFQMLVEYGTKLLNSLEEENV